MVLRAVIWCEVISVFIIIFKCRHLSLDYEFLRYQEPYMAGYAFIYYPFRSKNNEKAETPPILDKLHEFNKFTFER